MESKDARCTEEGWTQCQTSFKGCWSARSPTSSSRKLRSIGSVHECAPQSEWTAGWTHEDSCSCDSGSVHLPYEVKRVQLGGLKPPVSKLRSQPRRGQLMKLNSVVSQAISGFELMLGKDVVKHHEQKYYERSVSCVCDKKNKICRQLSLKKICSHLAIKHSVECLCDVNSLRVGGKGIKVKIDAKGTAEVPETCVELGTSMQKLFSLMCVEGSPAAKEPATAKDKVTAAREKMTSLFKRIHKLKSREKAEKTEARPA